MDHLFAIKFVLKQRSSFFSLFKQTKKAEILNERNASRTKPLGWSEAVLEVAVRWLMRQCGRIETECRHKSMELVHKLTPCISGIKETREYFQIKLKHEGEAYFVARFEGSVEKRDLLKNSLANFKTLPDLNSSNGSNSKVNGAANSNDHYELSYVLTWLSMLVAPLDCYTWIFGERLVSPSALLGATSKSCIWTSLSYFLENIVNYDLVDLIRRVYVKDSQVSFEFEVKNNKIGCSFIVSFLKL